MDRLHVLLVRELGEIVHASVHRTLFSATNRLRLYITMRADTDPVMDDELRTLADAKDQSIVAVVGFVNDADLIEWWIGRGEDNEALLFTASDLIYDPTTHMDLIPPEQERDWDKKFEAQQERD